MKNISTIFLLFFAVSLTFSQVGLGDKVPNFNALDQKGDLARVGAQVVGVSGDKPGTLRLFALEHQLNFTLLSDESGEIATLFDVPQNEGGSINREVKGQALDLIRGTTIQRWTFILDQKGILIYKDTEVDAAGDSGKVLEFLSSLQQSYLESF